MTDRYDHRSIERNWQQTWERTRLYQTDLRGAKHPYYNLMMFPYPSAEGLHVGNLYAFTGADIHGRLMSMLGYDVLEPMGFDAFGIHSENFAIKRGIHPAQLTAENVARFRDTQLKESGCRFDWSREVNTTDPDYYRWTQWIFLQLFHAGLAVRKRAPVNWCPVDLTVLADEQVIGGECERCGAAVEQRNLEQWFFRTTAYAERLLDNLDRMDWSEKVKTAQRAWIEDVIVDEASNGQGIGTALTAAMIERARALGCATVDLTSRPSREAANHLYKKVGFELRDTNVYRFGLGG